MTTIDKAMQQTCNLMPPTSSRAGVLSTDSHSPPVTKTTVGPNLLHPLNIITQLGIKVLREHLGILSSPEILLPVEEPHGDFELTGVLDDGNELFDLIGGQFTSTFVDINFCLFADEVSETTSKTFDFCEAEDNISLALNVSVEDTQDVLELGTLHH
ncbi:hypothetical protein HJC23_011054 [Cyclotella cryptica]|uniref:Uncharacterized protein n=1 Tax=Cyclotella cryptica TaxID=29204 RepID=A0ABD3PDS9_9STRA